ncbi:MAG: hypothetical protein FWD60_13400 [Candidatus Azobacteroides sp.]|nr:hypothetical protein [Candidatus Azobacteroides sp.]
MAKKQTDVIIANPIYDAVFKNLLATSKGTNKDIAGYFVGTILGEEIADIDLLPQEYSYHKKTKKKIKTRKEAETLKSIRLDFVATIHTRSGEYKRVLIEIQKSQNPTDLLRFRTYLGEQYKQLDAITVKDNRIEQTLPIVVIYMLGFPFPEIETIVLKVNRTYVDMINGEEVKNRSPFIECLTHDGYFIQIPRINRDTYKEWENCSELKKMLSLFEQDYFVEENFLKKYPYPITDKNIKKMVETLEYIAADPKVRREMQEEYWAAQNEIIWEKQVETLSNQNVTLSNQVMEQSSQIAELRRILQQAGINIPSV